MSAPAISVVMAAFNAAETLSEAIDSILGQSFPDFEFIILDDGSTDGTADIVSNYADERIRLVADNENRGLTHRLNQGLSLARADIIARMDADDVAHKERFQRQFDRLLDDATLDLVFSNAEIIDAAGDLTGRSHIDLSGETALDHLRDSGNVLIHSSAMMRKAAIDRVGGYDPALRTRQDYDLWMRCLEAGYRLEVMEAPLLKLRVHDGSISSSGRRNWQLNCVVAARSVLRQSGMVPFPGIEEMMDRAGRLPEVDRYVSAIETKRRLRMSKGVKRGLVAAQLLAGGKFQRLADAVRPTSMAPARQAIVRVYEEARDARPA